MKRRAFLKSLAAIVGVSVVPDLGFALPISTEPVKWAIEALDHGYELGVAAQWSDGIRYAVRMPMPDNRSEGIACCKQALRQWYLERGIRNAQNRFAS